MNNYELQEAFKALDILNEEDFDLSSSDGIEDLSNFMSSDETTNTLDVIDPEAETEEELKDDYVGKIILDCVICHSKIYKAADEIDISEDGEVNVGKECPFCFSTDGYTIIGEVAPYEESDEDDHDEDDSDEDDHMEESLTDLITTKRTYEGFEKVDVETDNEIMSMTAEDNGKVAITSEPKETTVVPVSDEIQAEINPVYEVPKDKSPEDTEIDMDIDDISEDEFNELGESYFKRVYSNVDSFKTTSAKIKNESLILEGNISFKSGKKKNTQFIFEGSTLSKTGKAKFIGENAQLSNGKKSFVLRGKLTDGRFVAESLNYNYRATGIDGVSQRVCGTVSIKK